MFEQLLVIAIVLTAAAWLVRILVRQVQGKTTCSCAGCHDEPTCPYLAGSAKQPLCPDPKRTPGSPQPPSNHGV